MNDISVNALFDELGLIEKQAGMMSYLGRGLTGWKNLYRTGQMPGKTTAFQQIGQIYRGGQKRALNADKSGFLGGLGALAKSRYGQMAAVPALGLGVGYGGYKMLGG